ncbi:uncharacterized protein LOC124916298 [Impatiens glandulifera]|uniref:uncharacterized protein LOC124916298 n=1 Tax=Impatiens glandulifera TaxID=253017 RepID=UPI001FB0CAD6|nr:uncharacterized protein LOC124916298 [Impatiens glandulifera]
MENTPPATTFSGDDEKKKKKKTNDKSFVLLKAAISLLRRKSKPIQPDVVSQPVVLNKIIGSIRPPLHLPDELSSPNCSSPAFSDQSFVTATNQQDLVNQSDRVDSSESLKGLRKNHSSAFASAINMLELGSDGESDDDDEVEEQNHHEGDEMIDRKADEFIANFYSKFRVHERK